MTHLYFGTLIFRRARFTGRILESRTQSSALHGHLHNNEHGSDLRGRACENVYRCWHSLEHKLTNLIRNEKSAKGIRSR